MSTVNIHEAKTHLSKLLERVEAGESITIARNGKPIAQLSAVVKTELKFGGLAGKIHYEPEAFLSSDPEILAMFDADFEIA